MSSKKKVFAGVSIDLRAVIFDRDVPLVSRQDLRRDKFIPDISEFIGMIHSADDEYYFGLCRFDLNDELLKITYRAELHVRQSRIMQNKKIITCAELSMINVMRRQTAHMPLLDQPFNRRAQIITI